MKFNNWNLEMDTFPVRQYDNLTRRLEVSGDIPDGWSWAALLSIGDNLNIISLQYGEPGLYVDLTADMIPYAGKYNLQLRATQGDKVRHTNIVQMQVNDSMSGDAVWPELPSEFSQAEQRITELNEHPPKPGDNGFWLTWNVETDQYEESDIPLPSGGGSGSDGGYYTPEVTQPSDGTMQVSFEASEDNMPPVEPVSVTLPAGPAGKDGEDGAPGLPGQNGYSPTVQTEQIEGGTRVTITDATGPKEFEVMNGTNGHDGQPGQDGAPGQDGFSPTASVTQTADGAKITITDKSGTTNATITNGKDGTNGTDGQTPNITPGNIETLPAGSNVTASITGQTPNLVLNLGIPQGPAGAGVPSTDGVPTDYLLSPAGWVAPPSGGGGTWELIQDITLDEDVKSIKIEKNSAEMPFSFDEIYINTNATNVAEQTVATLLMFKINSKNTYFIGTSTPMVFNGGKNGETGRNWAWVRSINPLIVMTGSWVMTNMASNKTVYSFQPNDINMDAQGPIAILNPYSVGEKISGIEIAGATSTSFFSAGSRFLVYGR